MVYARKSELKSAFRILGLSPESWPWLVMKAQDPTTGKWFYFIDKCLPFGASISCSHFQRFSNALCHLMEYRAGIPGQVTNYLDNFLFLALSILRCNYLIRTFLTICENFGILVSMEKTKWAEESVVFLGILLNGRYYYLAVPLDKREKTIKILQAMIHKKKVTIKELQSLCGYLNFLGKAIFPGRTFTRRMYAKYSKVLNIDESSTSMNSREYKLKQFHHVRLDAEFKADCITWLNFLQGDLAKIVNRPMVDLFGLVRTATDVVFCSDASANKLLGFGCIFNRRWIQAFWPKNFIQDQKPSIEYLELFALMAGILTWERDNDLNNCRISIFCDNQAVVQIVNNGSSSCKNCMKLLRLITLSGLQFNRRLMAKFVPTKQNEITDALLRGQWKHFRTVGPQMNQKPDLIAESIWPVTKIWMF